MFGVMYDPKVFKNKQNKKLEDLRQAPFVPNIAERCNYKLSVTPNLNKSKNCESDMNSKCSSQDSPRLFVYCLKPNTSSACKNIIYEDGLPTKISIGTKTDYDKKYPEFDKIIFRFLESIQCRSFCSKKVHNLDNILNPTKTATYLEQDHPKIQFFKGFYSKVQRFIDKNIISEVLKNETTLNYHIGCRKYPWIVKISSQHNHENNQVHNSGSDMSSTNLTERTLISSLNVTNSKCGLNLLCIFMKHNNFDDINLNLTQSWTDEDIKLVLPMTWNIVVACNVITITNESNHQNITIIFRNPLNTKVDYKDTCIPSKNTVSGSDRLESVNILKKNSNIQNSQMCDKTFSCKQASTSKSTKYYPEARSKSKYCNGHTTAKKYTEKYNTELLLLKEPLLLDYSQGKERRQILLYKDHSDQTLCHKGSNQNFCKTIENLLAKSVRYEGDPISLIFDPQKVIHRLKWAQKIGDRMFRIHSSEGKSDVSKYSSYKSSANHSNRQNVYKEVKEKNSTAIGTKSNVTSKTLANYLNNMPNNSTNPINVKSVQESNIQQKILSISVTDSNDRSLRNDNGRKFRPCLNMMRFKKKSRTAYKQVNVKKIVSSVFKHFFHFYSILGGRLKSGSVITKSNSNYWFKVSGLINDSYSLRHTEELFTAVAGAKVVLNIYDYLKFLIVFARSRKMDVADLLKQMMTPQNTATVKNPSNKAANDGYRKHHLERSQSLPILTSI